MKEINTSLQILQKLNKYKQHLSTEDLLTIKNFLFLSTPPNIKIKTYSEEDSSNIGFIILKSVIVDIYRHMSSEELYNSLFDDALLLQLYETLFTESKFTSPDCVTRYIKLKNEIRKHVFQIFSRKRSKAVLDKMVFYLQNKEDKESTGANFAIFCDKTPNIKNRSNRILNSCKLDAEFLLILIDEKFILDSVNLHKIFTKAREKLLSARSVISMSSEEGRQLYFVFAVIREVNMLIQRKCLDLLRIIPEDFNEAYLEYFESLLVDEESKKQGWIIFNETGHMSEILTGLQNLYSIMHSEKKALTKSDYYIIKAGLGIVSRVVDQSFSFFVRNSDIFINLMWADLSNELRGIILEICGSLAKDKEIAGKLFEQFQVLEVFTRHRKEYNGAITTICVNKSIYDSFEEELAVNDFPLTSGFVHLAVALAKQEMFEDEIAAFFSAAMKSKNPEIMMKILKNTASKKLLLTENTLKCIKSGITSNSRLCETFCSFCIKIYNDEHISELERKEMFLKIIRCSNLMNVIVDTKSALIFDFLRLFNPKDISVYLNEDFLERLSENNKKGLQFLIEACKKENQFCRFISNRKEYFNSIKGLDEELIGLYDVISDSYIEELDISLTKTKENNLLVLPEKQTNEYFNILSKLVLHSYFEGNGDSQKYLIREYVYNSSNLENYSKYLKSYIAVENSAEKRDSSTIKNIENRVRTLVDMNIESEYIADLVAYFNSFTRGSILNYNFTSKVLKNNILANKERFDNELFIKKFDAASKYEKYLLFLILDYNAIKLTQDRVIFNLIYKELSSLAVRSPFDRENTPLTRQCLNSLLWYDNLSSVVKLFVGIEISDDFVDLVVKINLKNMISRGKDILDLAVIKKSNLNLQVKICFFMWAYKLVNFEVLKSYVESLRRKIISEDLEYIVKEMQRNDY